MYYYWFIVMRLYVGYCMVCGVIVICFVPFALCCVIITRFIFLLLFLFVFLLCMFCFLFCVFCVFVFFVYCFSSYIYLSLFYFCTSLPTTGYKVQTQLQLNIIQYNFRKLSACNLKVTVLKFWQRSTWEVLLWYDLASRCNLIPTIQNSFLLPLSSTVYKLCFFRILKWRQYATRKRRCRIIPRNRVFSMKGWILKKNVVLQNVVYYDHIFLPVSQTCRRNLTFRILGIFFLTIDPVCGTSATLIHHSLKEFLRIF